ncbi:MAG: double-strand break repair protein AddB, partial [Paracoccaceae bacterium]
MFTPTDLPRLYGLPCGVDIAQAVVSGLRDRLADAPPQAMARVELIVNAERMAQRVRAAFDAGPPGLLPRIRLVSDCADLRDVAHLPVPVPALRRRLEVMQLVGALLEAQPDLAPRSARYDLADQLVRIYDEMVDEGVSPDVLEQLDTTDQSGHWARALTFLQIVRPFVEGDEMDAQTHMRRGIEARIARWRDDPPDHPVIVAGSTGSRGTTRMLMEAVARLPQGAVILPGVDPHMPGDVWQGLDDALTGED